MKKAKIMLTAIAVLGIAGGALAYKAKSAYNRILYVTTVYDVPGTSVSATTTSTSVAGPKVYYTTTATASATAFAYTIAAQ